ncbi:MAG: 2-hydroxyglutaryl-CoA dehydratase [Spirochaetes bacterium RBG_16_49_21]|nr:MAG: 2-hydroxyglutaryl-CoA dehydratase [Spirochaetes bacterium RBG_16_49_21]
MIVAGIDVGSTTTKVVVLKAGDTKEILGKNIIQTGFNHAETIEESLSLALRSARIDKKDITYIIGTGYGRNNVAFADKKVTEIACHGHGAHFYFPNARTIIDIGGQDSKIIKLDNTGRIIDFAMNEKCAAGTGRFLEVMAKVLQVELDQMGELSNAATTGITISSMCTVFAESEVISKISQGYRREDIINGLHGAVSDRVIPLGKRLGINNDIIMTGGVAKNKGIISSFEKKLDSKIFVPEDPQIIGALGAALIASLETANTKAKKN